jgi:hypothetical protein
MWFPSGVNDDLLFLLWVLPGGLLIGVGGYLRRQPRSTAAVAGVIVGLVVVGIPVVLLIAWLGDSGGWSDGTSHWAHVDRKAVYLALGSAVTAAVRRPRARSQTVGRAVPGRVDAGQRDRLLHAGGGVPGRPRAG